MRPIGLGLTVGQSENSLAVRRSLSSDLDFPKGNMSFGWGLAKSGLGNSTLRSTDAAIGWNSLVMWDTSRFGSEAPCLGIARIGDQHVN